MSDAAGARAELKRADSHCGNGMILDSGGGLCEGSWCPPHGRRLYWRDYAQPDV